MWETVIAIAIVLLAAAGVGYGLVRNAKGKSGCGGCGGCDEPDSRDGPGR